MALFSRQPTPVKDDPKPDGTPAPSTAYTGSAVSIVRKGALYVPVMLDIEAGRVVSAKVGCGDIYSGAEIKAGAYLRKRARG